MKKVLLVVAIFVMAPCSITAQTFSGNLKNHANQSISLTGFNYYDNYELGATTIDSLGNFTLNYGNYKGMGILKTQDKASFVVLLTMPNIQLRGTHLSEPDSLQFIKSPQNQQFVSYAKNYMQGKQAYSAWRFLQPMYTEQPSLKAQTELLESINKELHRLEQVDVKALNTISRDSYLHWFLPQQTLVNNMPASMRNYPERLPKNIEQFRAIDFNNPHFKTSGLFRELIEGHYFLLENMGKPLDSVYIEMNTSTDYLIANLMANDSLLNSVSASLFTYFEKRSLFPAAAHLSTQMLGQNQCVLESSLAKTMQKYSILKVGNIAPDINLGSNTTLSSIKKPVLLVFGASWCPHCKEEAKELLGYYSGWKEKSELEVVYISIDTEEDAFNTAYQKKPWRSYCDFKGWDTQAAKDYFVNATPTYLLLDKERKILVHPSSLAQVNAWVDYKL